MKLIPHKSLKVMDLDGNRGCDLYLVGNTTHMDNYRTAITNACIAMISLQKSPYVSEEEQVSAFDVSIGISLAFGIDLETVAMDLAVENGRVLELYEIGTN